MSNYVVEDGIDFFAELNKKEDFDYNNENVCLITNSKLLNNKITLPCNHSFNYLPLFFEVRNQKRFNPNEPFNLRRHQIRCPYCRQVSNKLLPYIPPSVIGKGVVRISGVNSPDNICMKHKICSWKFKSGKKKDCECKKRGFESDYGNLCETHFKIQKNYAERKAKYDEIVWSDEMEEMYNKYTVQELKGMLKNKNLKMCGIKKDLIIRLINNN